MDIILSAVLGEVATRSISFFINKCSKPTAQAAMEVSLESALLRAQVIVDEAAARHVTNQGMLRQLSMLEHAMYRGFHVLDTFRSQAHEEDDMARDHHQVLSDHSWALSTFNYAKRVCMISSSSSIQNSQELEEVLGGLRTMILDVSELLVILSSYPRLHRQPYSMHLLLDKCMFGRQMEMELVINFLLHTQPPCSSNYSSDDHDRFDVLSIVGPGRAGKSTLVTHVCDDERVRDHFSQIVFFTHCNFRDEDIAISREGCTTANATRNDNSNGRLLVAVDVVGDLDEDLCEKLRALSTRRVRTGSKIIITSRSDKITKLGTTTKTQALTLKHLPYEAYWYFFKVITFGSTDPKTMHPRFLHLAMEIAKMLGENLVGGNIIACLLRDNFSIQFWCKVLKYMRGYVVKYLPTCAENPSSDQQNRPMIIRSFGRMGRPGEDILVLEEYQTCSSQEEVPKISFQDVLYGSVTPLGEFKVLVWRSRIPPYHSYIYTCKIRAVQTGVAKRKRSLSL